ncbi:MAG: acyl-CoA dehydrogenase N-terminal domain-containing protein, partial [Proteobacteria bacterium]|nr:acyl-CoA dehydrogenase N-terminal domain-containing protein [Pseudomonadota bacterium]
MSFIVNRRDVDFLMYEILNLDELLASERYQDHDRETVAAVLDLAEQMAEEEFLPCA